MVRHGSGHIGGVEKECLYGEDFPAEGEMSEPLDPKDLDIVPQTMVVADVIERLKNESIVLAPDFQKNPHLWDDCKQSRLIESLVVRIPLPSFYFDMDDEDDRYIVVDGFQRLWAIRRFAALDCDDPNRLRLTGLEYLPEYNGKRYEELPMVLQRRIRDQALVAYVIRPGTPEFVRNSIFTRINTGGLQLTPAEIKNVVYRGQPAALLRELARSDQFIQATNHKVKPDRMLDCEFVNRFLAFYLLGIEGYKDNLEDYLNQVLVLVKQASPERLDGCRRAFYRSMTTANALFGKNAFRRITKSGRYGKINKPLFECVSVCLAKLADEECSLLIQNKDYFINQYTCLLRDPEFNAVITNATAKKVSIQNRNAKMKQIISKTLSLK